LTSLSKTSISAALTKLNEYGLAITTRRGRKNFYELPRRLPDPPCKKSSRLDQSWKRDFEGRFQSIGPAKLSSNCPTDSTINGPASRTSTRSSLNENLINKTPPSAPPKGGNGAGSAKAVAGPFSSRKPCVISKRTAEEVAKVKGQDYIDGQIKAGLYELIEPDSDKSEKKE
jgi:hypothetical protein